MGVDLEKKRKLLLYPIEYQRGCLMDMSACDRPVQVIEKKSRTARIGNSVNIFLTHFSALSQTSGAKDGGPADG